VAAEDEVSACVCRLAQLSTSMPTAWFSHGYAGRDL
jgi:hypothetical protein